MSLWLLLAAHFCADFSLQSADCAEKSKKLPIFGSARIRLYGCVCYRHIPLYL